MAQETIKIAGIDYVLKFDFKTLMTWEKETGRLATEVTVSITDTILMFWCSLKAGNPLTFEYTFDQFVDLINEDLLLLIAFKDKVVRMGNVKTNPDGSIPDSEIKRHKEIVCDNYETYTKIKTDYKRKLN